jgi:hypothetical protein
MLFELYFEKLVTDFGVDICTKLFELGGNLGSL